jgi:hypothetical protein
MAPENAIILALDLAYLSAADQLTALKKIVSDGYVQKLALERAVNEHVVAAVNSLLPIEKAALIKRIGAGGPHQQNNHVTWSVGESIKSGRRHILGACTHGRSWWDCPPDGLGNPASSPIRASSN